MTISVLETIGFYIGDRNLELSGSLARMAAKYATRGIARGAKKSCQCGSIWTQCISLRAAARWQQGREGHRKGRVASQRVVFTRRLCRYQSAGGAGLDHPLLKSTGHGRAALKGGQTGDQPHTPFLQLHALACNLDFFLQGADLLK
jgi:hypothetical protein